jgi:hypothetical protein
MKKFVALLAAFVLMAQAQPTYAADAYNAESTPSAPKYGMFLVGEGGANEHNSGLVTEWTGGKEGQWSCESADDPACAASETKGLGGSSVYPYCNDAKDENCVASLELTNKEGIFESATFVRNAGGKTFPALPKYNYVGGSTPSLWSAPNSPSASGTTDYAVVVRAQVSMDWSKKKFNTDSLFAKVIPYRQVSGDYKEPYQFTVEGPTKGSRGVAGGGHSYECAWNEEGACGITQDFAEGVRVRLTVRMSSDIGGWFRGRIKNPSISVTKQNSKSNIITVEAEPTKVARLVYQAPLDTLSDYETQVISRGGAGSLETGRTTWSEADQPATFKYLENFRPKVKDTASGTTSYWNFSTTKSLDGNKCLGDNTKVQGIVTTNSMVYDGGVPKFSGGFLNYKVAGLHYAPGGQDLNLGVYDLVMRSDTARCLYGFSKAPLSATVSVVNEKGTKTTATTVVSEKNGWLKMAAYGFTFSKKTIKVKVTKKKK